MEFGIYIGLLIIVFILVELIGAGSTAKLFLSHEAGIVVGLGLVSATLINFPFTQIKHIGGWFKILFKLKRRERREDILLLLNLSQKLARQGRSAVEGDVEKIKDDFLKNALTLAIDNVDPEHIKVLMKEMIAQSENRHEHGVHYFEQMAKYSPGLALIGTLCGLIKLMANLSDPSTVGPNMALALVCTFYGVIMANLVFLPMSDRLKVMSYEEIIEKERLVEAVLAMASGEPPVVVREKIFMLISLKERQAILKKVGGGGSGGG